MIVFLYRPSPQVPEPSIRAANKCFEASRYNIYKQREQMRTKSVDVTWIFTQSLFMALNTLLWALSYAEIRKEHRKSVVENHLHTAQEAIFLASKRWPGVESALELYGTLIQACLKAYDGNSEASYVIGSPSNKPAAGSVSDVATPPPLSTPSTIHSSLSSNQNGPEADHPSPYGFVIDHDLISAQQAQSSLEPSTSISAGSQRSLQAFSQPAPQSVYIGDSRYQGNVAFNPMVFTNPLPSPLNYELGPSMLHGPLPNPFNDQNFYLGSIGDQCAQYLNPHYPPQETGDSLNLEQQVELMNTLEREGLDGMIDEFPTSQSFYDGVNYQA